MIEGCQLMRDRLVGEEVAEQVGFDPQEVKEIVLGSPIMKLFRQSLFARVVPNIKRLGLLSDRVRRGFEELEIIQFENVDPEAQDRALGSLARAPPRFLTQVFTVSTGQGACCTTRSAMLPSSRCLSPERPRVPITIRSACWRSASSSITVAG